MNQATRNLQESTPCDLIVATAPHRLASKWWSLLFMVAFMTLTMPLTSHADSRTGTNAAQASLNFRIVIPAVIRVTAIAQPDHVAIEDQHIAQGYIDLDAATSVKLTINSRGGYLLSASYDARLLSSVEVKISSQNLMASSGFGSMRVASGLTTDKLVPIGYRLHLAPGVRTGNYRWPVALAFSLAMA